MLDSPVSSDICQRPNGESLDIFRLRARQWIQRHLLPIQDAPPQQEDRALNIARQKMLQKKIFDAGFAGLSIPQQYGGAGLTLDHQRVWAEEIRGFEAPSSFVVSIGMILPTLLEFADEDLKQQHIPRMLRGEEIWLQLLSEPNGGSDMAGALTRASRNGSHYVLNGSKMWSTGAGWGDFGLCLARVDWQAPKHAGLSMLAVDLKAPGVTIEPIIPVDRQPAHFFMEYFDDVQIPLHYRLGKDGDGWTIAQRLLFHERNATAGVGYGYGLSGGDESNSEFNWKLNISDLIKQYGGMENPHIAYRVVSDYIDQVVAEKLSDRINQGMQSGKLQGHWGSLLKLGIGMEAPVNADLALAVSGCDGVIWPMDQDDCDIGLNWLRVRGVSIAGGSNEIQRNIVSERLLGLPREPGQDKNLPFSELNKTKI